jgi:cation/acetate symporter
VISYTAYRLIHLVGIVLLFVVLGGLSFAAARGEAREGSIPRGLTMALHGVALLATAMAVLSLSRDLRPARDQADLALGNVIGSNIANIALILGTAGLPHILIRFLTVPDAKTARTSIVWATWIIGLFYLVTPVLGYGAALYVGQGTIRAQNPEGNLAAPQLASVLGGPIFFAFISAVAFATIVAVVAGLVLAASSAFAHDFYTNVFRGGEASDQEQFRAARIAAIGISVGAIALSLPLEGVNVAFLVALAFAVAASANVPVILLTIFWRRFNTTGAVMGILVGLISCVVLIILSPNVMTGPNPEPPLTPIIPIDPIFPFVYPALFSVPLGVLGCILGTLLGGRGAERAREQGLQTDYDEIYVRSLTGISNIEQELEESTPAEEPRTT